jgi:hypothetical protein
MVYRLLDKEIKKWYQVTFSVDLVMCVLCKMIAELKLIPRLTVFTNNVACCNQYVLALQSAGYADSNSILLSLP